MEEPQMVEIVICERTSTAERENVSHITGGASVTIRYPAAIGFDWDPSSPPGGHRYADRQAMLLDIAHRAMDLLLHDSERDAEFEAKIRDLEASLHEHGG